MTKTSNEQAKMVPSSSVNTLVEDTSFDGMDQSFSNEKYIHDSDECHMIKEALIRQIDSQQEILKG